jgi:uncharacterized FlgJ-related protein
MLYKYDKYRSRYVIATRFYVRLFMFILGMGLVTYVSTSFYMSKKLNSIEYITEETRMLVLNSEDRFSEAKLKEYLVELNIKFPHIVFAQAKLESGNFKSTIFLENNNLFGMKVARRRPTTNKGENRGHAYFNSWRECVVDYAFYQAAYLNEIKTESQYLQYLRENYAENPQYYEKVKNLMQKY